MQHRAGHITGSLRAQESNRFGHILRLSQSAQRDGRGVIGQAGHKRGFNEAGGHGIDLDAVRAAMQAKCRTIPINPAFEVLYSGPK